jgi:hypothetical protein
MKDMISFLLSINVAAITSGTIVISSYASSLRFAILELSFDSASRNIFKYPDAVCYLRAFVCGTDELACVYFNETILVLVNGPSHVREAIVEVHLLDAA